MEAFRRFDAWLIEKPYQGIVDFTKKKPAWWVEQCGFAMFVFGGARFLFEPEHSAGDYVTLVMNLIIAGMFFFFSRMPSMIKHLMGDQMLRVFLLVLFPFGITAAFSLPLFAGIAKVVVELAFVSAYYFAVCDTPRPRKKKEEKLVEATS